MQKADIDYTGAIPGQRLLSSRYITRALVEQKKLDRATGAIPGLLSSRYVTRALVVPLRNPYLADVE